MPVLSNQQDGYEKVEGFLNSWLQGRGVVRKALSFPKNYLMYFVYIGAFPARTTSTASNDLPHFLLTTLAEEKVREI
jgi:hypothetical protein